MFTDNDDKEAERKAPRIFGAAELVERRPRELDLEPADASRAVTAMESGVHHSEAVNWGKSKILELTGDFTSRLAPSELTVQDISTVPQNLEVNLLVQQAREYVEKSLSSQVNPGFVEQIQQLDNGNFTLAG